LEKDNKIMGEKYLRKSCNGDYALGCYELGILTKEDSFLKKACGLGHKPACKEN